MNSKHNILENNQDNIQARESIVRQDIQQYEHACQSEQYNHGNNRINMLRQIRESINIIIMSTS